MREVQGAFARVLLGDIAEVRWGDTQTTKSSYQPSGYLAFSATGPDGFMDHFDHEGPGIVLSAIGAQCGKTWFADGRWSCIKNTIFVKARRDMADTRFLYYATSTPDFWPKRGAAQPFISQGDGRKCELLLPPLETQRHVASILGAYDDLIEVNRRRVAVLEEMARGLFEEWFVRFRCPGHEDVPVVGDPERPLPEGWHLRTIGELGEVITGKTPSKAVPEFFGDDVPFVKIPDLHASLFVHETGESLSVQGAASQSNKMLPEGSLCVSCIGTIGLVSLTTQHCQTNQQINALVPHDPEWTEFLYFSLLRAKPRLINLGSNGATMGNVNKQKFSNVTLAVPEAASLTAFHQHASPMMALIQNGEVASRHLAAARDLLLPRLISGKLSVEAATRELEDAI